MINKRYTECRKNKVKEEITGEDKVVHKKSHSKIKDN